MFSIAAVAMLVSTLLLSSSLQAQDVEAHIFLPMVAGSSGSTVDGPSTDPFVIDEVTAAGSCYWSGSGRGSFVVDHDRTVKLTTRTTANCRDINIHSSHCGVDYHIKGMVRRGYVWVTTGRWQTVVNDLPGGARYELKISAWDCSNRYTTVHYAG